MHSRHLTSRLTTRCTSAVFTHRRTTCPLRSSIGSSSSALTCSIRAVSMGSSDEPPQRPARSSAPTETSSSHLPGWVSTQKTNGERRMSVSIRSGAQRQRARRPPNVPPYAPAPSAASAPASASLASPPPAEEGKAHVRSTERPTTAIGDPLEGVELEMPPPSVSGPQQGGTATRTSTSNSDGAPRQPSFGGGAMPAPSPSASATKTNTTHTDGAHPLLYSVSRFTEPVKRIILIRNGRSEANEDVAAYVNTPDWRIPLVEEGKRESIAAGRALSELTGDDPVYFYYSPYIRSRQSLRYVLQGFDEARLSRHAHLREWWEEEEVEGLDGGGDACPGGVTRRGGSTSGAGLPLEAVGIATTSAEEAGLHGGAVSDAVSTDPTTDTAAATYLKRDSSLVLNEGTSDSIIGVREDVRLRDGDIGRYTTREELMHHLLERERYGKFFYRFPHGESGADVCDRVTSFLDAFQRERVEFPMNTNVVIITHGLTMRMFIKRWFHLTVDTFHRMKSPPPGSLCTLTRLHHRSCFRLDESCVESMNLPLSLNEFNGYKYRNKQLLGSMSSGAPYM